MPELVRRGDDELDGHAVDRHAERARSGRARRSTRSRAASAKRAITAVGIVARDDDGELVRQVARSAAGRRRRRRRARPRSDSVSSQRAVERQPAARLEPRPVERGQDLRLGRRADARHLAQPLRSAASRSSSAVETPSALPSSTSRCGPRPDEAPEPDELRANARLELVELGEPPGLDELAQPRLDRAADARAARAHGPSARAPRPAPASRGSARPRAGTRARCRSSRPARSSRDASASSRSASVALSGRATWVVSSTRWRPSSSPSAAPTRSSASAVDEPARRALADAMLADVLAAAAAVGRRARRRARRRRSCPSSATLVADPRRGQGAAVEAGARRSDRRRRCRRRTSSSTPTCRASTPRDLLALAGAVPERRPRARGRRRRDDERARLRRRRACSSRSTARAAPSGSRRSAPSTRARRAESHR